MPIHKATKNGKPGFQWGQHGAVYVYMPGNAASRERAKQKAVRQAVAISKEACRAIGRKPYDGPGTFYDRALARR